MKRKVFIMMVILIVILALVLGAIIMINSRNTKKFGKEFVIKENESARIGELELSYISSGHRVLISGGDMPFFSILAKTKDKSENITLTSNDIGKKVSIEKYSITPLEIDFFGRYAKIIVDKK